MNKQKVIELILSDMRDHFKEAKRYGNRKDKNMTAAAFKNAREGRDKLYEYMTTEEVRQRYIAAYEEVFEVKERRISSCNLYPISLYYCIMAENTVGAGACPIGVNVALRVPC